MAEFKTRSDNGCMADTFTKERAQQLAPYIELSFKHVQSLSRDRREDLAQVWRVTANLDFAEEAYGEDEEFADVHQKRVAEFRIVKVNFGSKWRLIRALDDHDGELFDLAEQIFDLKGDGDLHPDLEGEIEPFGDFGLVLDSARTVDQWRGTGIGTVLASAAIDALLPGCRFAVLIASPLRNADEDLDPAAEEVAKRKLTATWRKVGFVPWRNDIMFLDPALRSTEDAMAALRTEFDL